jgi:Putative beta-barrel porin-2, OmpL-like. bbp2/Carboxypeptidase regulatory-like domain
MNRYLIRAASILLGTVYAVSCCAQPAAVSTGSDESSSTAANILGTTRGPAGEPLAGAQVIVHALDGPADHAAVSGDDGAFTVTGLKAGRYELKASMDGFASPPGKTVDLAASESLNLNIDFQDSAAKPVAPAPPPAGFFRRFVRAYKDDWKPATDSSSPPPKFRGFPAPATNPPFPFTVWPYGGSVVIGQPWTQAGPLMTAIWGGSNGDWWKKSGIQIYGWLNAGANVSTSKQPGYSNFPEAYAERGNSIELDQEVLYIERQPDTVQTDHVDWGFRISGLYGLDYRFTTATGWFDNQLLGKNQENGFDMPMAYVDLYVPQVAQGMDIRAGRYISLPDIEAQLAPNNYTYSHSLLYTFDCYTQTGINTTTKLTDHWLLQLGVSAGCETAPWNVKNRKLTGNACLGYTWRNGLDNIYVCDNTLNDGRYAYNNLTAYYTTWYHKYSAQGKWHSSTEGWYQYEAHTPNVNNPAGVALEETGANGAICNHAYEVTCYAPEWAIVNYQEYQISTHNYVSIRNEYFDDMQGQRTGFRTPYTEHLLGWGHWVGTTILFRPELRFEHAYDASPYDNGTRRSQLTLSSDVILFF